MTAYNPYVRKCAGRFRNYLDDVDTILETEKIKDQIYSFIYISMEGTIKRVTVDIPESPASSIVDLAREYDAEVMVVRNVYSGYRFKITRDIDEMLEKYGRIYGYYWSERYNCFSKRSDVIYAIWKPEWVVTWFRTKEQARLYRDRFGQ